MFFKYGIFKCFQIEQYLLLHRAVVHWLGTVCKRREGEGDGLTQT